MLPVAGRPDEVLHKEDPEPGRRSYPEQVHGVSRADLVVALCFVAAGVIEAATSHRVSPGLLVFDATGSLWLGCLAVRRTRPVVTISVLAAAAGFGTVVTQLIWPDATESGGVWLLALMLAAYSLGAHAAGRVVPLGVLLPALVVSSADIGTRTGWDRVNGMLFVTVFIGLLPTAVGRAVRVRRGRLAVLHDQHEQIARAQRARQESATLAERLRVTERLHPTLVAGLRSIAAAARTRGCRVLSSTPSAQFTSVNGSARSSLPVFASST